MLETTHKYIEQHPIKPTDKRLILGTIHPHFVADFKMDFFYGNRNSIWNILRDAFPTEIPTDYKLDDVHKFLTTRKIAISDTILKCTRKSNSALDSDLIPDVLNMELITQIKASQIKQVLCTSGFGKNNAFRLFYEEILGRKLTKEIRVEKKVILPPEIFGREVTVFVLPSPSGAANISLSRTLGYKTSEFYTQTDRPVYRYKVNLYRNYFNND